MKCSKKAMMVCIAVISVITFCTTSFADSAQTMQDTNGDTLQTGKMYCVRPVGIEPKVNITVDDAGNVKLNNADRINPSERCKYTYRLVGDNLLNNRGIVAGETIRFEEMKKGSDGAYTKTKKYLKTANNYINSSEHEYIISHLATLMDYPIYLYDFSKFNIIPIAGSPSRMKIHTYQWKGDYVWSVPYSTDTGEKWLQLQHKDTGAGIMTFEFESVK
ncbi:hypothetical protein [Bacillus thuringiensis]|uniref:hypothetical protein n=1 Tax=Bacillus thuringiensis TaxID=1428 RepID=UPI000B408293|nr:hypothetical protein [Bacillus thuringiensis]ARX70184.1 hypothetical protein BVH75_30020 [Bacillus thuringiensis]MEB9697310.1 hypothetical protein [Bacillus cereus]